MEEKKWVEEMAKRQEREMEGLSKENCLHFCYWNIKNSATSKTVTTAAEGRRGSRRGREGAEGQRAPCKEPQGRDPREGFVEAPWGGARFH